MDIRIEMHDEIGRLSLNRSGTNSLNYNFLTQIYDGFCRLESNGQTKIIILDSLLDFGFSSGLDLGDFFVRDDPGATAENIFKAVALVYKISQKILHSPLIYLASLSGAVIGSAITLAVSCDLRIAAANTWLWSPDPQYGGLLADGGVEISKALVGSSRAAMLHLTNERINAKTANEWGFFYKLVEKELLDKTAMTLAQRLLKYSFDSLGSTKRLLNKALEIDFPEKALKTLLGARETLQKLSPFFKKK